MFIYAIRMKSQRGRIVLIGVSMYFFIHFLFNVGGVTGLIPLTGVPLLMISAGGSSTLSVMVAVGMGPVSYTHLKSFERSKRDS